MSEDTMDKELHRAADPTPPPRPTATRTHLLQDYGVYAALLLLVLYNLVFTENFASVTNLNTQLVQVTPTLIAALGMALVIGTEGVDLSVGSVMALAAALLPLYLGYGLFPAVLVALLGGALCGLFSGTLVSVFGIQPIVATLALLVGGRGLALVFADGQLKDIRNSTLLRIGSDKVVGIPIVVVIAVVLVLGIHPPVKVREASTETRQERREGYREVLKDWRYTVLSLLNVLVLLEATIFTVGVPLWVVQHTSAPSAATGTTERLNLALSSTRKAFR
ncbi:ABC transporter permease [Kibdelosporangium lantanae]|uniref:ABC transporter permease n=1 Tax=Kibdelosporangium lantanae TaxID=1497396 RepID=A0ABW3MAF8_9PSEU